MFPNVPKREKPTQLNAFSVDGQGTFPQGENVPYLPSSDRERQQGTQGTSKERDGISGPQPEKVSNLEGLSARGTQGTRVTRKFAGAGEIIEATFSQVRHGDGPADIDALEFPECPGCHTTRYGLGREGKVACSVCADAKWIITRMTFHPVS